MLRLCRPTSILPKSLEAYYPRKTAVAVRDGKPSTAMGWFTAAGMMIKLRQMLETSQGKTIISKRR